MWNVDSPPQHRGNLGLAPIHREIDRKPPYLRIATEEAWNIPEILEAQVRLLASPGAPDDPSLRMAGMFSKLQLFARTTHGHRREAHRADGRVGHR